jgi:hypothetical protein
MKVLLYEESGTVVLTLLEQDIVVQGHTPAVAFHRLQTAIKSYKVWEETDREEGREVREHPPAPLVFWNLYALSACYDGQAPAEFRVRVWRGQPPFVWGKVKK